MADAQLAANSISKGKKHLGKLARNTKQKMQ